MAMVRVDQLNRELNQKINQIGELQNTIAEYNEEIEKIRNELDNQDSNARALAERQAVDDANPRNIAAEDALDVILRLEKTLKVIKQRNELLKRDQREKQKQIREYTKELEKVTKEEGALIEKTGYYSGKVNNIDLEAVKNDVERMNSLEQEMLRNIKATQNVLRKKTDLLATLQKQVEDNKKKEYDLLQLYNDIRVTDRDCKEAQRKYKQMQDAYNKDIHSQAMAVYTQQNASVAALQYDNEFLKAQVKQCREEKRRQEDIISAQMERTRELRRRLELVNDAIKDMRCEKELEKAISKDATVPVPEGDPYDMSRIKPKDENIPVELYELLHRDNEAMQSIAQRKQILAAEKTNTLEAQEVFLDALKTQMKLFGQQQQQARLQNEVAVQDGHEELVVKCEEYRSILKEMGMENAKLKAQLSAIITEARQKALAVEKKKNKDEEKQKWK